MSKINATILIIDDDEDILLSAKLLLKKHYTNVVTQNNPKEINQIISKEKIDVIVLDMNYRIGYNDGKEGMYWLNHILSIDSKMIVVLMTAYGEVTLAVEAIKKGAFDFILKPWSNEKFLTTIRAGLELRKSNEKLAILKHTNETLLSENNKRFGPLIGNSQAMNSVMDVVKRVSVTDANILILGENGTGKQHLAREIHRLSKQSKGPFIHVDLGSLNENLFESKLFGHKKGAFTDAYEDKPGRFEIAENGTIFLDEIGNLPLNLQSKLLAVLQEKKTTRIGESIERPFNARILFATNAPLKQWVAEGKFRQDLLFRINTVEIEIPPLRDRPEDIIDFITHFLSVYKDKYHKPNLSISEEVIQILKSHNWPGNIREIQHTIERSVIMSDGGKIKPSDFNLTIIPKKSSAKNAEFDSLNIQDVEKLLVEKAIKKHDGNISKAAKELGLTRAALYRRMEKYNL